MTNAASNSFAMVIEPRGRAVLCVWAALPGAALAPFMFWQGLAAGLAFCALWAALDFCIWARACSFVAAVEPGMLEINVGIVFRTCRVVRQSGVSSALLIHTPLLRLAGASFLLVRTPGGAVFLPAVGQGQAERLYRLLLPPAEGGRLP